MGRDHTEGAAATWSRFFKSARSTSIPRPRHLRVRPFRHGKDLEGGRETVRVHISCLYRFDFSVLPVNTFDGASP